MTRARQLLGWMPQRRILWSIAIVRTQSTIPATLSNCGFKIAFWSFVSFTCSLFLMFFRTLNSDAGGVFFRKVSGLNIVGEIPNELFDLKELIQLWVLPTHQCSCTWKFKKLWWISFYLGYIEELSISNMTVLSTYHCNILVIHLMCGWKLEKDDN